MLMARTRCSPVLGLCRFMRAARTSVRVDAARARADVLALCRWINAPGYRRYV